MRLTRRRFLARTALAGAGVVALSLEQASARDLPAPGVASDAAALFGDPAAAAAIGRHYLAVHPEEADAARLLADVLADAPAATGDLWSRIAAGHRADFERGEVTLVDGWVLSRTEARLCAVTALASSGAG